MHRADPQLITVIIIFAHVVRSSVTFQNKTNFKRKQCSLPARLWVCPSGSLLMTPVLSHFVEKLEFLIFPD